VPSDIGRQGVCSPKLTGWQKILSDAAVGNADRMANSRDFFRSDLMKTVMIVDDDSGVLRTVSLVLRTRGYEVVPASSGLQCLELARSGFRGVILMDIIMPGIDGWQTIAQLRDEKLLEGSLICMLTGCEYENHARGVESFVFDYLAKPFSANALLDMVTNAESCLSPG
jgi:CheY-like chemotaxis protein